MNAIITLSQLPEASIVFLELTLRSLISFLCPRSVASKKYLSRDHTFTKPSSAPCTTRVLNLTETDLNYLRHMVPFKIIVPFNIIVPMDFVS